MKNTEFCRGPLRILSRFLNLVHEPNLPLLAKPRAFRASESFPAQVGVLMLVKSNSFLDPQHWYFSSKAFFPSGCKVFQMASAKPDKTCEINEEDVGDKVAQCVTIVKEILAKDYHVLLLIQIERQKNK